MSQFDNFISLVQSEAIFMCLSRPGNNVRPSAILSVALQCPPQVLSHNVEGLRFQAQELTDWFFGGPDPEWLPEQLMYEEVEELVEEFIEVDELIDDDGDFEYEIVEEFVEGDYS
jgi:hypothetical protein